MVASFVGIILSLSYLGLAKENTEIANHEINSTVLGYFNAINKKEYIELDKILYPTDNSEYILTIAAKAQAVGMESMRLKTIYPSLVDGNIAVVGFESSVNNYINDQHVTFQQTNLFFMLKKDNHWYVAKPSDLANYDPQYLSSMIEKYDVVIKKNLSVETINKQQEFNNAGFSKIKKAANQ